MQFLKHHFHELYIKCIRNQMKRRTRIHPLLLLRVTSIEIYKLSLKNDPPNTEQIWEDHQFHQRNISSVFYHQVNEMFIENLQYNL